jgi:ankyrin repeat protein
MSKHVQLTVMTDSIVPMSESMMAGGSGVAIFVRPVCVDTYSRRGRTPLQAAVAGAHTSVVKLLVEKGGADVNLPIAITDEDIAEMGPTTEGVRQARHTHTHGRLGLHCAGSGALIEACQARNAVIVDLLLEYGAVDHDNRALHAAMMSGDRDLSCKLLCRQVNTTVSGV